MNNMCRILAPYTCKNCGQDMLFFTTSNNTLIDYKRLLSVGGIYELKHYLESRSIRGIKCLICNKEYVIDWTKGYPEPLLDKDVLKQFGAWL